MQLHPRRSRRAHRPAPGGFVRALVPLLLAWPAALAAQGPVPGETVPASTQFAPERVEIESSLPDGSPIRGSVDRSLVALRDRLRRLLEPLPADSPEDLLLPIDGDFSVALDRPGAIEARIPLLEAESQRLESRLAELRGRAIALREPPSDPDLSDRDSLEETDSAGEGAEPTPAIAKPAPEVPASLASEIVTAELRLAVARARTAYLRALASRLADTPDVAKTALMALGAPRVSLRSRSDETDAAATALRAAARRLTQLAERLEAGGLVGFVVQARELAGAAREQAGYLVDAADELAERAVQLSALAEALEAEGARVRTLFLRAAALDGPSKDVDRPFEQLLQDQRRLRRMLRDVPAKPGDLAALRLDADALAASPVSLGTTEEAREVTEDAASLRGRAESLLSRDVLGLGSWRLASVNDAVALLSTRISREERERAYALSSELVSDLRSEAEASWRQMRAGWERMAEATPGWREIFTADEGRDLLTRAFGILAAVLAFIALRRRTSGAAVAAVRRLSHWSPMRPHLGSLVRWTGLLQTVLPVALLYPVYWVVRVLLRPDSLPAEVLAAVFLPLFAYSLVRQVLIGATREITRGRPALVRLVPETRARLLTTYRRLGLVVAWAAVIDSLAILAVGPGRIVTLVDGITGLWVAIWAGWASVTWRVWLAERWQDVAPKKEASREAAVARWMAGSGLGFLLSPVAFARVLAASSASALAGRLSGTTLASRLRAMFLRRLTRRASDSDGAGDAPEIPAEYTDEFPLYPLLGEEEGVLVPRQELVDSILSQISTWQESGANGSAVLVGEKGSGKTTLAAMVTHRVSDTEIVTHTLRGTLRTERDLVGALADVLDCPAAKTVEALAEALRAKPKRIVVLDEAHSVFLRVVGGYRAYDTLVSLVNTTTDHVFWLLVFTRYTWSFLDASRSRNHYFRRVIEVPDWTADEIQDLIRRRTARAGYDLVFSEVLRTDGIGNGGELDLIDGSEAYFRLLWEASAGNPRVATRLWLDSLTPAGDKVLEVGLFSEATPGVLSELGDELVFALAAIAQRENLSTEELAMTLNLPLGFAQFAARFLSDNRLVEPKGTDSDRVTLAPLYYRQVLRLLRSRHLLLE